MILIKDCFWSRESNELLSHLIERDPIVTVLIQMHVYTIEFSLSQLIGAL